MPRLLLLDRRRLCRTDCSYLQTLSLFDINCQDDTEEPQTLQKAIPKSCLIAEQQSRMQELQKISRREQLVHECMLCVQVGRSYTNLVRALSDIEKLCTCSFANPRALFDNQGFSGAP